MKTIETFIRSTIFNILFFGITAAMVILLIPTAFMPRKYLMMAARIWLRLTYFLERYVLNLRYEVRGIENLPRDRTVIIAAKHQSAYETFKLHILFGDPAIILKKELLKIPLWGLFLSKIDPIAIDRSDRESALRSMLESLDHVKEHNRPIVIFPQGTRVKPHETAVEKPYKTGVARMAIQGEIDIVPVALNTGLFWPKLSWIKQPGTVIFEFLPLIQVDKNTTIKSIVDQLQNEIETHSIALMDETRHTRK